MHLQIMYNMYKKDLALNNLQWLICHKTQYNQTKSLYHTKYYCLYSSQSKVNTHFVIED